MSDDSQYPARFIPENDSDQLYQTVPLSKAWMALSFDDIGDQILRTALMGLREEGLAILCGVLPDDFHEDPKGLVVQFLALRGIVRCFEDTGLVQPHYRRLVSEVNGLADRTSLANTTFAERQKRRQYAIK